MGPPFLWSSAVVRGPYCRWILFACLSSAGFPSHAFWPFKFDSLCMKKLLDSFQRGKGCPVVRSRSIFAANTGPRSRRLSLLHRFRLFRLWPSIVPSSRWLAIGERSLGRFETTGCSFVSQPCRAAEERLAGSYFFSLDNILTATAGTSVAARFIQRSLGRRTGKNFEKSTPTLKRFPSSFSHVDCYPR